MNETVLYFRAWRFDRTRGSIDGVWPLDESCLPVEHCCLVYDERNVLVRLEEHKADHPLPFAKLFGYESEEGGLIKEALDYNPDGSLRLIHRYIYDETGRMVDRVELDGAQRARGHVTSSWDENGNEVEECVYRPDGKVFSRHCYEYDDEGRMVTEKVYDGEGSLEGTRTMAYDGRGNVVDKQWCNAEGLLQSRFVNAYDEQDRVVRTDLYGSDGTLKGSTTCAYDECGNPIDPALLAALQAQAAQGEEASADEGTEVATSGTE